ncbi:ATP-dependent zinc protease [Chromohalobacter sp. TMW 2.2308]|uniref:ATP-dependent zinc protease n=1 Tax=Chromohalobacter canadensis TaxID=141389 RepID=A0ABZ0YCE5_9GAMM|nr:MULTISPECIES: ATP-dependent zinc protease [Chromohalobacter]MCK0768632.1 ATP-dependent zinc protease [Chromohalobacter canadensis]MCK2044086.1 ATP-dependent zinc protease [Chromohalobacter moromii]MCT8515789.1 ATP-dependent zinc protease [Chromohalobacter sp. TMW 2.2271]WQH09137.1 ATP-dependent zinc protease [Chromohalobacter canadensis]
MRSRSLFISALCVGVLTLAGCAVPQATHHTDDLTETAFNQRLESLESNLALRCSTQTELLRVQAERAQRIGDNVRANGKLLRHLRADVENIGQEPRVVTTCPIERSDTASKEMLGRNEWVGFPTVGTYLKARVDSGANTSSLSAHDVTEFERDGESWVRFKLALEDDEPAVDGIRDDAIEAPVTRRVKIIQASGTDSRPVISLLMTLGPLKQRVEFTLNDRSHLDYPVLLGRRFFMDIALIDVSQAYIHPRPEFPGGKSASEAEKDQQDNDSEEEAR